MKVTCRFIFNRNTGKIEEESPWVTIGKVYPVLCLAFTPNRTYMRIVSDDDGTPILKEFIGFEITDPRIAPDWSISMLGEEHFALGPPALLRGGFWEEYFDGNSAAEAEFEAAVLAMEAATKEA